MFKLLRKYNKWILAVGGTLLMLVFLIPEAIQNLSHSAGVGRATRATIEGPDGPQNIPARVWHDVSLEAEFLRQLERAGPVLPFVGRIVDAGHWFLLSREAEDAGLVGSPRAIPFTSEQIQNIALNTGYPQSVVRSALAKVEGIERLISLYLNAGELSDRRLQQFAARVYHAVDAEIIAIQADGARAAFEPTEDELQRHFEEYRHFSPGEGPRGFGYRLPDRIKLEWIRVPADAVSQRIEESEQMDRVALRVHWRRNPDGEFPQVEEGAPVPDVVRRDRLRGLTSQTMEEISRYAYDQLRAARRGLPQRAGYLVLPDDWDQQRLGLAALAEQIQARFEIDLPEYRAVGDRWLSFSDLDELEGIGRATTDRFGRTPLGLRDLVEGSREFGGSPLVAVQAGVAAPPLRGPDGDVYIFRILEAEAARPPHSVDEVREQLVADLRRAAHYQELVETSSAVVQEAIERGMLATALRHDAELRQVNVTLCQLNDFKQMVQFGLPPQLLMSSLPIVGRDRATIEAIIDHALSLPTGTPIRELPEQDRIFTVPADEHTTVLVVRLLHQRPLAVEEYRELAGMAALRTLYIEEEMDGLERLQEAFSYDTLKAKHKFRLHIVIEDDAFDPEELEALDDF